MEDSPREEYALRVGTLLTYALSVAVILIVAWLVGLILSMVFPSIGGWDLFAPQEEQPYEMSYEEKKRILETLGSNTSTMTDKQRMDILKDLNNSNTQESTLSAEEKIQILESLNN